MRSPGRAQTRTAIGTSGMVASAHPFGTDPRVVGAAPAG
jgi:hypothetical protein